MFGLLLKKQFIEFFRALFYDYRKKKMRSPGYVAFYICLMFLVGLSVMGMMGALGFGFLFTFHEGGMDWFYFVLASAISLLVGMIGSAFATYASLYKSKDNEALLAMPIPVGAILGSRLVGVLLLSAAFTGLPYIAFLIVYWGMVGSDGLSLLCQFLLLLALILLTFSLSCLLGWVIGKLSLRIKNKSLIAVILSLIFIGIYFSFMIFLQPNMQSILENAVNNKEAIESTVPLLLRFGEIGLGAIVPALIVFDGSLVIFGLVLFLLIATFLSMVTSSSKTKKSVYVAKESKQASPVSALIRKEFKHFAASPAYMLNCGFGCFLAIVAGVALFIKGGDLIHLLDGLLPGAQLGKAILPVVMAMVFAAITAGCATISLEGKNFYELQILPVSMRQVIKAKFLFAFLLRIVPSLLPLVAIAVVTQDVFFAIVSALSLLVMAIFFSLLDIALGVWKPLMEWNNETVAVKQNINSLLMMAAGFIMMPLIFAPYLFVGSFMGPSLYYLIIDALLLALSYPLMRYLMNGAAKKLETM